MKSRPGTRTAFSLLELLTVIAVISLMAGLTIPAVSSLSKGRSLANGGNLVAALAQQARQNSLTRSTMTALVLASAEDGGRVSWVFCLMELAPGASQWSTLTRWEILPEGVVVDSSQSGTFLASPAISPTPQPPPFRGRAVTEAWHQIFAPDGSLHVGGNGQPDTPPALRLVPAVIEANGTLRPTAAANTFYEIRLNTFTGLPRVDRL